VAKPLVKAWARAIVVLLLALLSINRAIEAFREYRKSVELKDIDPSASYMTFAQGDVALALFVAVVAIVVWRLKAPRPSP
jgi:hypothetical protein